jgi:putative copper export protein
MRRFPGSAKSTEFASRSQPGEQIMSTFGITSQAKPSAIPEMTTIAAIVAVAITLIVLALIGHAGSQVAGTARQASHAQSRRHQPAAASWSGPVASGRTFRGQTP